MTRLLYFLLCLLPINTIAQQQSSINYSISRITPTDGLSQGSSYFRFEDSKGFMWITGNDALNRYDGNAIKVYNLNYFFKDCPALQQGYGFAEDEKHLYVGSPRGLYVYDYDLDLFTLVEVYKNAAKTKTAMPICYAQGKIWCFNEQYQLASLDIKTRKVQIEAQISLKPIKSVHVYDDAGSPFYYRMPFLDKNNNICFIGKEGVELYNLATKKTTAPTLRFSAYQNCILLCAAYDKLEHKLYLGTHQNGILILSDNYKNVEQVFEDKKEIAFIEYNDGKIIFKYRNEKQKRKSLIIADKSTVLKEDNSFQRALNISYDKAGRLWLCDDGQGDVILDFKGRLLKNSNDLAGGEVFTVSGVGNFSELPDKRILIQHNWLFDGHKHTSFFNEAYSETFADEYRNGTWLTSPAGNENRQFTVRFLDANGQITKTWHYKTLEFGFFQHLAVFKHPYPMLSFSNGLYWLNTDKGELEKINSLPDNSPFYINKISNNRIAISYLSNSMILVESQNDGNFKMVKKILPSIQSFYIQEDEKQQQYWVGTNEGVYLLDKNFELLKKFDKNNGLAGTYIYGILLDDFGTAWCSHQRGLSSIDTRTHQVINFDKNDGIQDWDFNNCAFLKASDGTLYFGGVNGFNYFKPPLQFNTVYKPKIYFDEILINSIRYAPAVGINNLKEINLKNKENNIAIKVLVRDLGNASQQEIRYRVKNIDTNWKQLSTKTPLNFSSLAPGKYEIEFGISNKFQPKIQVQKKLVIHIAKAFYQAFWFWALLGGLVFGGIVYAYSRWKIQLENRKLQQILILAQQRNKITADLHDDIGASLSSLQINSAVASKLAQSDNEEAVKMIRKVEEQSQKLSETIGDFIWSIKSSEDEFMNLGSRVKNFAAEILGATNINYVIDIDDAVNSLKTSFSFRKNSLLIIKEAINNAVKYSKANNISISIKLSGNIVILSIMDDGTGILQKNTAGNGLQNMQKRAEELGGTFELSTAPHKGTAIIATLPTPLI